MRKNHNAKPTVDYATFESVLNHACTYEFAKLLFADLQDTRVKVYEVSHIKQKHEFEELIGKLNLYRDTKIITLPEYYVLRTRLMLAIPHWKENHNV